MQLLEEMISCSFQQLRKQKGFIVNKMNQKKRNMGDLSHFVLYRKNKEIAIIEISQLLVLNYNSGLPSN